MELETTGLIVMAMMRFWLYAIPILLPIYLVRRLIFD